MNWLARLPGSRREPAGLEWTILRRLPRLVLVGTVLPVAYALVAHFAGWNGAAGPLEAMTTFYAVAAVILHWTVVVTLAFACAIVTVMKGPAYGADLYRLPEEPPGLEPRLRDLR